MTDTYMSRVGKKLDEYSGRLWPVIYFLLAVYIAALALYLALSRELLQAQYIPDDGYYYLTLAKNFVETQSWTFDLSSSTSGFHLIWAYLLAALYAIFHPNDAQFISLSIVLNASLTLLAVMLIGFDLTKQSGSFWGFLVGGILISTRNFIFNSFSITEWSLVILCAYLLISRWQPTGRASTITFLMAALLGPLARSDFVLLPVAILAVSLLVFIFERKQARLVRPAAAVGLTGLGFLLVGVHNYIFTSSFFQSSALIKAYWTRMVGLSYLRSMLLTSDVLGFDQFSVMVGVIIFTTIAVFTVYYLIKALVKWDKSRLGELAPYLVAGVVFLGYTIFYFYNGAVQPWYTCYLLLPVWLLGTALLRFLWKTYGVGLRIFVTLLAFGWIGFNVYSTAVLDSRSSPWPHQAYMLHAIGSLQELPGPIGSWNAGIPGYYLDGKIINIDGLVNNDIYPYILNNNLYQYLLDKRIDYIVDYENMVEEDYYRWRGGYSDGVLVSHLKPVSSVGNLQYFWKRVILYRLIP